MSKEDPGPIFELTLPDGQESIFTDQTAHISLKTFSKETRSHGLIYTIKEIEVTKGELSFDMDSRRHIYDLEKVKVGDKFSFVHADDLRLIFKPAGEIGQASIKLTFHDKDGNNVTVNLNLEVKSSFKVTLGTNLKKVFINQAKKVNLDIVSNDEGAKEAEYTVKKVKASYGELQFENGEILKPGSKLKYGFQQLVFKISKNEELRNLLRQNAHYLSGSYFPGKVKSDIKLTLMDDKGNEINATSNEFEIYDVSFYVEVKYVRWSKYELDPDTKLPFSFGLGTNLKNSRFDEGFIEVKLEIKDTKDSVYAGCSKLQEEFGKEAWKIIACRSSDGSPVTLADLDGREILGVPIDEYIYLYFRLEELSLRTNTTLTLTIEGPCESIEEVTIDIPADQKDSLMNDKIIQFFNNVQEVNEGIVKVWLAPFKDSIYTRQEAKELSQKAENLLAHFVKTIRQFGNHRDLLEKFHSQVLDNVKKVVSAVDTLKANKAQIDAYYGF